MLFLFIFSEIILYNIKRDCIKEIFALLENFVVDKFIFKQIAKGL